jgi:UDP-N-acetylmuramoyl-L-alanyl-D-glutamate--2,6-diaminopimelate ligase
MEIAREGFLRDVAKLGEGRVRLCEDGRVSEADTVTARPWAEAWRTIGVTGTNGKTSTTVLAAAAIRAAGRHVFSSTTLDYRIDGEALGLERSWPSFLAAAEQCHRIGGRHAVVEITSQALARGYATRWRYDIGVFTNLSPDHFKTHGSWEHYLASKAQLFVHLPAHGVAVLNARDPAAALIDRVTPAGVRRLWFGAPSRGPALFEKKEDLAARAIEVSPRGTRVLLQPSPLAEALGGVIEVALVGEVFAENALAAACAAHAAGIEAEAIRAGLAACPVVPGRFELIVDRRNEGTGPVVAVDYAHTPDALVRTCATARALAGAGRVIVVFGAGGESDAGKREPMGEAVGAAADLAVVTTDNPRREDPRAIAAMLVAGLQRGGRARVLLEADRARAIALALEAARPEDVVVIAGKGHETGQTIGEETLPFSDRELLRGLLAGRGDGA